MSAKSSAKRSSTFLPIGFFARNREDFFHRGIQTRDVAVQIDRQQADVDRFDDRFVELFQQLELSGAVLLLLIKQAVLDRDRDVAGHGAQNLHVFGRKQRAISRPSQANHRHHPATHHARHVVMQRAADKAAAFRRQAQGRLRAPRPSQPSGRESSRENQAARFTLRARRCAPLDNRTNRSRLR